MVWSERGLLVELGGATVLWGGGGETSEFKVALMIEYTLGVAQVCTTIVYTLLYAAGNINVI